MNLKNAIEEGLDLPVFIENDANIALECERWIGSGKDFDDIVMITLGTGLGGAVYNPKMGLLKGSNCQGAKVIWQEVPFQKDILKKQAQK